METVFTKKQHYLDVLLNLDNSISIKQSELEKTEHSVLELRLSLKSLNEDRERVIGALGVISEIEEELKKESALKESNTDTNKE